MNNSEDSSKNTRVARTFITLGLLLIVSIVLLFYFNNNSKNEIKVDERIVVDEDDVCNPDKTRLTVKRGYWPDDIKVGDVVTIVADIEGKIDDCQMVIVWKYQEVDSDTWIDIDPVTDSNYQVSDDYQTLNIVVNETTVSRNYYAVFYYQ